MGNNSSKQQGKPSSSSYSSRNNSINQQQHNYHEPNLFSVERYEFNVILLSNFDQNVQKILALSNNHSYGSSSVEKLKNCLAFPISHPLLQQHQEQESIDWTYLLFKILTSNQGSSAEINVNSNILLKNLKDFITVLAVLPSKTSTTPKSNHGNNNDTTSSGVKLPTCYSIMEKDKNILKRFIYEMSTKNGQKSIVGEDMEAVECTFLKEVFMLMMQLYLQDFNRLNPESLHSVRKSTTEEQIKLVDTLINQLKFHVSPIESSDSIPIHSLESWLMQNAQGSVFGPLYDYLFQTFFVAHDDDTSKSPTISFQYLPKIEGQSSILSDSHLWLLNMFLPTMADSSGVQKIGDMKLLYSATRDGFSMNQFEYHCFKYNAPTLFLIKARSSTTNELFILGLLLQNAWKKSKNYYGCDKSLFFEILPYPEAMPVTNKRMKTTSNSNHNYTAVQSSKLVSCSTDNGGLISIDGYSSRSTKCRFSTDLISGTYSFDPLLREINDPNLLFMNPKGSNYARQPETKRNVMSGFIINFMTEEIEVFGLGHTSSYLEYQRAWRFESKEAERKANINATMEFDPSQKAVNSFILEYGLGGGGTGNSQV